MNMKSMLGWTMVPAVLLASGVVFAKPPMAITHCDSYITKPGKYWLANDLACDPGVRPVKILSSDVSLDLRGHSISCAAGDRSGVVVGDNMEPEVFSNVRISNGSVNGCAVGVLLWFTDGARVTKMSFSDSTESGITLVEAAGNFIRKNDFDGDFWAITSYGGTGNQISHNTVHNSFAGIDFYGETDSRIACNYVEYGLYALSFGPLGQTASSGNLVRGNRVTGNFLGITLYGVGTPDEGLFEPRAMDNLVHANSATGNWWDMLEAMYNPYTDDLYEETDAACQNTWKNNQFDYWVGPVDCSVTAVELDEVCALDFDD